LHGGPAGALRAAIHWRDAERAKLPPKPPPKGVTWRFFSANTYGGWGEAEEAAKEWLLNRHLWD
jgi:hypothetical protein